MEYRTLGGSGAVVSGFAIGTMTFGAETPLALVLTTLRAKCNDGKAYNDLVELMKSALTEFGKEFQAEAKAA